MATFTRHSPLTSQYRLDIPQVDMQHPPQPRPAPGPRSPLREISPPRPLSPTLHDHMDDEDQPRRRRVPDSLASAATLVNHTSSFFDGPTQVDSQLAASISLSPIGSSSRTIIIDSDDDEDKPVAPARAQDASSEFGDDDDFANEELWAAVDQTQTKSMVSRPSSSTIDDAVPPPDDMDVIDISDDEDKENMPVPTRHVRRRVANPAAVEDVDIIELSD